MSKALLSVNNYYYLRGGAEKVFLDHNQLLASLGWQVAPFAMTGAKNLSTPWSDYFVQEIEFGESYSLGEKIVNAAKIIHSPEAKRQIRRLINDFKPDIAHAHNIYHHLSTSILPELRRHNIPVVMTLHDLKLACPAYTMISDNQICEQCKSGLYHVAKNRCMKGSLLLSGLILMEAYFNRYFNRYEDNVSRYVVPSQFYIDKFVEWGFARERFVHIPNFVEPEPGQQANGGVSDGANYFVYAGRLSHEKGLLTLINAAAEQGYPLVVAGTGPLEAMLKARVEQLNAKNIEFVGYLDRHKLAKLVADCRAVIVPSEWYENCPMSVIEAFLAGKPVIGSDVGGISEMVDHEVDGFKFEMGNVESLATIMNAVASFDKSKLATLGENAHRKATTVFSKAQYQAKMLALYDELMTIK